ncbi:MAG: hypothetical protein ACUVS9_02885 [Thermaceae bacterium]
MTLEERVYKLEGLVEGVMATLPQQVHALVNSAFNRLALLVGIWAAFLAVLTFLR